MKLLVAVLLMFDISLLNRHYKTLGEDVGFTLWKNDLKLPGPSLCFKEDLAQGIFQFEFKTFVKQALMLYQDDEGFADYIDLTLVGGKIRFSFYIRAAVNKHQFFWSKNVYNDFEWHTVTIERNTSFTSITLKTSDSEREHMSFNTMGKRSVFTSKLQLGGFTQERMEELTKITRQAAFNLYASPMDDKRGFFNTCVKNIKYGINEGSLKPINDIKSLRSFAKKGDCHLTYCDKPVPICKNQGICSALTHESEDKVKCDCHWTGFEGKTCTIDSLELTLNGTYQVTYNFKFRSIPVETYKFRIKTRQQNARIVYTKRHGKDKDKLIIEIRDSMMMITSNVGSDDVILKTKKEISDGKWHLIEYRRNKTVCNQLIMDRKQEYSETKRSHRAYSRQNKQIYLGEKNNAHTHQIKLQDFIWKYNSTEINFISGLYNCYTESSCPFTVTPNILPIFNRELPSKAIPSKATVTTPTHGSVPGVQYNTTS